MLPIKCIFGTYKMHIWDLKMRTVLVEGRLSEGLLTKGLYFERCMPRI